ncbi:MAG: DUF5462 family protein [Aeromonas allosaccharophila]
MTGKGPLLAVLCALVTGNACAVPGMSERTQSLGLVNGQVNEHRQVEVSRMLSDPVLVRASKQELGALPARLVLRQAQGWSEERGVVRIVQVQPLPPTAVGTPQQALLTLKVRLEVDGKPAPLGMQAQGEDLVLLLPVANESLVLRSDQPLTLTLPSGYRGALSLPLEFEGWSGPDS